MSPPPAPPPPPLPILVGRHADATWSGGHRLGHGDRCPGGPLTFPLGCPGRRSVGHGSTVTACRPPGRTVTVWVSPGPVKITIAAPPPDGVTVTVVPPDTVEVTVTGLSRARGWVTVVVEPGPVWVTVWVEPYGSLKPTARAGPDGGRTWVVDPGAVVVTVEGETVTVSVTVTVAVERHRLSGLRWTPEGR